MVERFCSIDLVSYASKEAVAVAAHGLQLQILCSEGNNVSNHVFIDRLAA
jgi:hypothetical protein